MLKAKDSSLLRGTISNEAGAYTFDHIPPGRYIVKATAVGYTAGLSRLFTTNGDRQTIPDLWLRPASRQLSEVSVTAARPLIEHTADRTVVNMANSILATGNSALDILQRAPGVSIDKDDNISLKGKSGVNVMIDDKPTYLSAAQLATLLRSTDGTTIQSIELMSNPSARYDAAGNSGSLISGLKRTGNAAPTAHLSSVLAMAGIIITWAASPVQRIPIKTRYRISASIIIILP